MRGDAVERDQSAERPPAAVVGDGDERGHGGDDRQHRHGVEPACGERENPDGCEDVELEGVVALGGRDHGAEEEPDREHDVPGERAERQAGPGRHADDGTPLPPRRRRANG